MGKIYNGADMNTIEVDDKKDINEIIDILNKIGTWVVNRDDIKFRDDEIKRVYNILRKYIYKSVLLVGDYGSGKKSVVEGYSEYVLGKCEEEKIFKLDFFEILKIATNPTEFERIVSDIFYASSLDGLNITININNIGELLNTNLYGNAGYSFVNKMIKYIDEYGIKIIATATYRELKEIEDHFPVIFDYFTVIKMRDFTVDESSEIILDLKEEFESQFKLKLPKGFERLICDNADRYIKDKALPGKAENLLDEVCSYISNKYSNVEDATKLFDEINDKKISLFDYIDNNVII